MYNFTDNAMESGVAICDTDITNDNFMHLKYSDKSDFICEAPNGVLSHNELTVLAASGLKVALANGKDDNKAYKSTVINFGIFYKISFLFKIGIWIRLSVWYC